MNVCFCLQEISFIVSHYSENFIDKVIIYEMRDHSGTRDQMDF